MNEQNLPKKPEPISPPVPVGGRSAYNTQVKVSDTKPIKALPLTSAGSSDTGDKDICPAPSALANSKTPYLARHFKLEGDIIRAEGILPKIKEIDNYILALVKERNWVDNEDSYKDILKEITKSLGLNENLDVLTRLEKLLLGTRLIGKQRFYEKMAKSLKIDIDNLK